MFLAHKVLKYSFRVDSSNEGVDPGRKVRNIKFVEPDLESTPTMEGSTLAGKYKILKIHVPVLESTPTLEGSTPAGKTESYFCSVQMKSRLQKRSSRLQLKRVQPQHL